MWSRRRRIRPRRPWPACTAVPPAWLPLLQTIDGMAGRCLYDPADTSEWDLARGMVCLGALKFGNLSAAQKRLLYLTAAVAWAGLER